MRRLARFGSQSTALSVLTVITALYYTLVVFGNITDFDANRQFVQHVFAMDTTFDDPDVMWRSVTDSTLVDVAYIGVIVWEALIAAVLWAAAVCWLRSRGHSRRREIARGLSSLGWIMVIVLFAGGFITIGGEWFQMWQSQEWNGLQAALQNFLIAAVGLILAQLPQRPVMEEADEAG